MSNATLTRRNFLMVAGAAAAACASAGCSNMEQTDMPATGSEGEEEGAVEIVHSSCRACISNCGVLVHVRDGRVLKVEGDPIDPMSKGRLCPKGLAAVQALYNPNRMKYPMKRVGERGTNQWERIS